ncbi:MAG: GldG family protein [Vicinamibacterales bacterium]
MMSRVLGAIGWIGTALVFAAVAVRFLRPEWIQYAQWGAWAGLVCVLVYMAGHWRDVAGTYQGRAARYGTLSVVSILIVAGILVAVNYLAARQNKRWDLTANQVYSLSDQTVKVLETLDAPVTFTVFDQETNFDRFRARLDEYTYHSPKVSVEYVDMDRQPARARQAEVQSYGTILVAYKDRVERVTTGADEQAVTNALIKAVTGEERTVYFTQGHGEKDPTSSDREGYQTVADALGRDNYKVERLVLAQTGEVPADATVIIIAGPQTDFLAGEVGALSRYMAKGGKVLVLLDPPEGSQPRPMPALSDFLNAWGLTADDDIVVDASGIGQLLGTDASVPVAASYPAHPITDRFQLMTAFPLARSITPISGGTNGHTAQPIVETSPQSWAEHDMASLTSGQPVEFNAQAGDRRGPIVLGAAVSAPAAEQPEPPAGGTPEGEAPPARESRLVAIGDSDFAANYGLGIQGNQDFFLNTVNWLAQQENLIAIRPREPEDRRITLTADQQSRVFLLSVFLIPGLIFGAGVYTWWRRR